jgi:branched-chain amino acid transport system substrate-binding protein
VNAKGGVLGRKIKFTYLDDGYDPARAVNNTIRLVQQDQVFAMFSTLGTNNNLAIRKFLNQVGVPQLFVSAGATTFGRDYTQYPWTIGYIPPYSEEGKLYGKYVVAHVKRAKIAVLYQNDDYGRDLLAGLRKGLGAKASSIVAKVGYDPTSTDVQPQIAQLKASKANVLCVFAFGKFSLQAYNGLNRVNWHPQVFVNDVSSASALMIAVPQKAANGSISIVFGKDPATPVFANDKGVKLFQTIWRKYGSDVKRIDFKDGYLIAGMATAYTMVDTLKKAGKNLTRQGVMRAATHLNEKGNPFLVPGIVVRTTPSFRFPLTQVKLQRWNNRAWHPFGKLVSVRPG